MTNSAAVSPACKWHAVKPHMHLMRTSARLGHASVLLAHIIKQQPTALEKLTSETAVCKAAEYCTGKIKMLWFLACVQSPHFLSCAQQTHAQQNDTCSIQSF